MTFNYNILYIGNILFFGSYYYFYNYSKNKKKYKINEIEYSNAEDSIKNDENNHNLEINGQDHSGLNKNRNFCVEYKKLLLDPSMWDENWV